MKEHFCQQVNKPVGVERDPYEGPVADLNTATAPPVAPAPGNPVVPSPQKVDDGLFHSRHTRSGVRNMQDSSFSLGGRFQVIFFISAWTILFLVFRCTNATDRAVGLAIFIRVKV